MNYKKIKKEAFKNIKHGYFKNVIVVFVCLLLLSGGISLTTNNILKNNVQEITHINNLNEFKSIEKLESLNSRGNSNSEILNELINKVVNKDKVENYITKNYTHGFLSLIINEITSTHSVIFSFINSINKFMGGKISLGIIIIVSNILLILFRTIYISVVEIGKNRYFLEERRYLKTNMDRLLYPYKKKKTFHLAFILFIKNLYLLLWSFTIVGFFIKFYEYRMISYVLAENPNIKLKEAFLLSKELTKGEKFNLFKLDLIIILYRLFGLITLNLSNIFFTDIYQELLFSETYVNLRKYKYNELTNKELLNDNKLYIKECINEKYPDDYSKKSILNIDYNKEYDLNTYILLFFSFSCFGWLWEVFLNLLQNGNFVNRGTMHGPWLPIYGFGGLAILIFLKRFRKEPWKLFIAAVILCAIIEYSTAWYLETFMHLKYWDYSGFVLNIHGRICLEGLIIFGLGGCGFTYIFAPILDNIYKKINLNVKTILVVSLVTVYLIDFTYSTFIRPNKGEGITTNVIENSYD